MNTQSCIYPEGISDQSQLLLFTHCLEVQIKAGCDVSLGKRPETDVKYILL